MKPKALVIEDNEMNLELACAVLVRGGFSVCAAMTAAQGLEMAAAERPDVILMDIGLPDMDGLSATQLLKLNPATSHIPVIALTAHVFTSVREEALSSGCAGYLTKPLEVKTLADSVRGYLRPIQPIALSV